MFRPHIRHADDPTPRYAFVEGNCFLMQWRATVERVHDAEVPVDFSAMRYELGAQRLYWYDSVLDVDSVRGIDALPPEKIAQAKEKSRARAEFLESVQASDGFIVRGGTSRGSIAKNRLETREKEVDVLLAVDSLLHAANGSLKHALILGGDLDHRPVVEALMQLGVFVTVYAHERGSLPLRQAADSSRQLDYDTLYNWTSNTWKEANPKARVSGRVSGGSVRTIKVGQAKDRTIMLQTVNDRDFQAFDTNEERMTFSCEKKENLLRFLDLKFGEIEW